MKNLENYGNNEKSFIAIFKKKKQDFLNFHNKFIKNVDFLTKKYQLSALLPLG